MGVNDAGAGDAAPQKPYKLPVSVLVVVYTPQLQVLMLERADRQGFWQSVTGSQHPGERLAETAATMTSPFYMAMIAAMVVTAVSPSRSAASYQSK